MWSLVKVWNFKFENKTTSVFNVPCYSCSLSLSDILSLKSIPSWAPVNGLWWGSVWRTVLDLMWWVFLVIYQFPPSRVRTPGTYWARHLIVGPCLVQRSLQGAFFQPSFLFLSESEISKYQRHSVGDLTKMLVLDINSMWRYFDYFTVSSQWKTFSEELCCSSLFRRSTSNLYRTLANYLLWVSTGSESAEKQEICWVLPSLGKILGKWGKVR